MTEPDGHPQHDKPVRAAVFRDISEAEAAVVELRKAGFSSGQISVLCSQESGKRHFHRYQHEQPAGTNTPEAATTGGILGALFGSAVSVGVTTAAGVSLLAAGPSFLIGGAVAGGFIGAMQTRGMERSLADYYDQALTRGDLLVAVEDDPENRERLDQAEACFRAAGGDAFALEHG